MIDPDTRAQFELIRGVAHKECLDLAESLDRAGLLVTKERKRQIGVGFLNGLVGQLDRLGPSRWVPSVFQSPVPETMTLAVYASILAWAQRWRDAIREGEPPG